MKILNRTFLVVLVFHFKKISPQYKDKIRAISW